MKQQRYFLVKFAICVSIIFNFQFSIFNSAHAQDTVRVQIKPYGFIRNYYTVDSRRTYTVVGGEYNMIPYDVDLVDGVDLNDVPNGQLQALTSRFGVAVTGPTLCGWATSGRLEADFGGFGTNNTVLRLRLAYVKFEKKSHLSPFTSHLVIGQDWHPLSGDIMPDVLGMAAGAPFRPHSRTPQVRATMYAGAIGYTAALLWQLQYMNNGPVSATNPASTASIDFAHRALWPEAFLGANLKSGALYMQLGVDAQLLRPRTHALVGGTMTKVDEKVLSLTPTLYAQLVGDIWSIKFRTLLAQNTSHLNQLVGYAVTGVNPDGSWSYSPMNATISYLNISLGNRYRANLFLGYMKNLGAGESLWLDPATNSYHIYMKGGEQFTHLNSVWRIAPSFSYNLKAFNLGLEYEVTACTYGNLGERGQILLNDNLRNMTNHRVCLLVKYNF